MKDMYGREIFEESSFIASYFGEFAEDFDLDAIFDEATEIDPRTGNRYWKDDVDFEEVVARHQKN
jgi:hypothetical protein